MGSARQERLINPYEGDLWAERSRRATMARISGCEQQVLTLLTSVGGRMDSGALLNGVLDDGYTLDEFTVAVERLGQAQLVETNPRRAELTLVA